MLVSLLIITKQNKVIHVLKDPYYGTRHHYREILGKDSIAYLLRGMRYVVKNMDDDDEWISQGFCHSIEEIIKEF